ASSAARPSSRASFDATTERSGPLTIQTTPASSATTASTPSTVIGLGLLEVASDVRQVARPDPPTAGRPDRRQAACEDDEPAEPDPRHQGRVHQVERCSRRRLDVVLGDRRQEDERVLGVTWIWFGGFIVF